MVSSPAPAELHNESLKAMHQDLGAETAAFNSAATASLRAPLLFVAGAVDSQNEELEELESRARRKLLGTAVAQPWPAPGHC